MFDLIFLMAPPAGQGQQGNPLTSLLPMILIVGVLYFFMIRPQSKKAKEQKLFKDSLLKGDKIVTIGGLHGQIVEVLETTYIVEVGSQTKIKIEKGAISPEFTKASYPKDSAKIATETKEESKS